MSECKFEIGKTYKTRAGFDRVVIGTWGDRLFVIDPKVPSNVGFRNLEGRTDRPGAESLDLMLPPPPPEEYVKKSELESLLRAYAGRHFFLLERSALKTDVLDKLATHAFCSKSEVKD